MQHERKAILYIATSVDGFIAKPGDDLSFLSRVEQKGQDYGYYEFLETVDTVILGRKTYDWVMKQVKEFPYSHLDSYVISRSPRHNSGKIKFYTGNLNQLLKRLKKGNGMNIFIVGGAEIVNEILKEKLIDQFYISVIPVLLGDGIRLFNEGLPEQNLILINSTKYDTGLVQLHYDLDNR